MSNSKDNSMRPFEVRFEGGYIAIMQAVSKEEVVARCQKEHPHRVVKTIEELR